MINDERDEHNIEESGSGLTEAISWHLRGRSEENTKKIRQDIKAFPQRFENSTPRVHRFTGKLGFWVVEAIRLAWVTC
jgi:hypothetical protein